MDKGEVESRANRKQANKPDVSGLRVNSSRSSEVHFGESKMVLIRASAWGHFLQQCYRVLFEGIDHQQS